jgi:hypothetical protein
MPSCGEDMMPGPVTFLIRNHRYQIDISKEMLDHC